MRRRRTLAQRLPVAARWRIAHQVNRLRWSCWSDLVEWAIGSSLGRYTLWRSVRGARSCAAEEAFARNGACYCAKVRTVEFDRQWPGCTGRATRPR